MFASFRFQSNTSNLVLFHKTCVYECYAGIYRMICSRQEWSERNRALILCVQKFMKILRPAPNTHRELNISSLQLFRVAAIWAIYYIRRCRYSPAVSPAYRSHTHMTKRIKQSKAYYITRNDFNQHPDIWCPASKKKTFRKYIASIGSDRKEILGDERDATFIVIVLETRPQPHSKHIQYEYVAFHEAAGIYRTRIYMHTCVCALCFPQIRAFSSRALLSLKNMSFCADTPLQFFFIRQAKYEISGRNRRMESEKR